MSQAVEHALTRKQFGRHLSDFAMIKDKFARMSVSIYAMESMAYLTAGALDSQEDADCSVEAAVVKVRNQIINWELFMIDILTDDNIVSEQENEHRVRRLKIKGKWCLVV